MTKQPIPLKAEDISQFARVMVRQLNENPETPSHLSMMNMLARAAGFRNFQHLRASQTAGERMAQSVVPENVDYKLVEKTLLQFDASGRMKQWPARRKVQDLCLWGLWACLPPKEVLAERDVNGILQAEHAFGDAAILRRSLASLGFVTRNADGSDYCRCERHPTGEGLVLIEELSKRRATRSVAP
jgi:hypothetical protein